MINNKGEVLHYGMIGLCIVASIIILCDKQRFRYELFLLILAYFLYVIFFKFNIFQKKEEGKEKLKVHKLQEQAQHHRYRQDKDKTRNQKSFLQSLDIKFQKQNSRIMERQMSRDQPSILLNQSSFDKSNVPLRLSMSKSRIQNSFEIKQKEGNNKQLLNLLKKTNNNSQNDISFSTLQKSAYVPHHSEFVEESSDAQKQLMKNCMDKHIQTLKKMSEKVPKLSQRMKRIKKMSLSFCKESLKENLENISEIIKFIQEKYLVVIECSQFSELEIKSNSEYSNYLKKVGLEEMIKTVINNPNFNFTWELRNDKKMQSLFLGESYSNEKKSTLTQKQKKDLKKLIIQRFKLDEYLDSTKNNLKSEERINLLRYLRNYIQRNDELQQYSYEDALHISVDSSRQKRIALYIFTTKINNLIKNKENYLLFQNNKSWFNIFRQSTFTHFNICTTVGADYGHPHYDFKFRQKQSSNPQVFFCEYGAKNYLSLIYMYFWTFKNKKPKSNRESLGFEKMVSEVLDY